ncbi:hypothetical protein ACTXT7_014481 [Hymenolepis weldensis]
MSEEAAATKRQYEDEIAPFQKQELMIRRQKWILEDQLHTTIRKMDEQLFKLQAKLDETQKEFDEESREYESLNATFEPLKKRYDEVMEIRREEEEARQQAIKEQIELVECASFITSLYRAYMARRRIRLERKKELIWRSKCSLCKIEAEYSRDIRTISTTTFSDAFTETFPPSLAVLVFAITLPRPNIVQVANDELKLQKSVRACVSMSNLTSNSDAPGVKNVCIHALIRTLLSPSIERKQSLPYPFICFQTKTSWSHIDLSPAGSIKEMFPFILVNLNSKKPDVILIMSAKTGAVINSLRQSLIWTHVTSLRRETPKLRRPVIIIGLPATQDPSEDPEKDAS